MLRTWWKIIRLAILGIGLLLSFFAVIEIIRAYQTLYDLHPAAGYVFLGFLFCGIVWIVGYVVVTLASRPAILIPPLISDANSATSRELRRYGRYLTKYINRLSDNAALSTEEKDKASEGMMELALALDTGDNKEAFLIAIEKAEEQVINPILDKLDAESNKEIRACVGVVMAGVVVSPYKAVDLIIVLYRNLVMLMRIVRIYNSRPRFRQQLQILGDTIKVVATVNYINVGKSLLEGLGSIVPYTDVIAQGIGAGFMTSVAGHSAMYRCRAFKGWDEEKAKESLRNRMRGFYTDIGDIFKKDILPMIMKRLGDLSKEKMEEIRTGISAALGETGNAITSFVRVPMSAATAAGKAGKTGGRAVMRTAVKGYSTTGRHAKKVGLGIFRGMKSAVKKCLPYPKRKSGQ
ncbi:MAG: YcjF family protein [Planctomycetota bacterium]